MSNPSPPKDLVQFFQSIEAAASDHRARSLGISDETGNKGLGLVLLDATIEEGRAAHLLRKTALSLTCPREENGTTELPTQPGLCQVTVEERAQLFTIFGEEKSKNE